MHEEIPSVRSLPFIGSLFEIDSDAIIGSLTRLAAQHGPIFRVTVLGQSSIILGSQEYVSEVCDESRFGKLVHSALLSLRPATGDGLFTAHTTEPNWEIGHRILMPAFGPVGIRAMFPSMLDIARQMMNQWERQGEDTEIDVSDAMTRVTLDTLALCAFDHRFNSFHRDRMHPFVDAMVGALSEAMAREQRPKFVSQAMISTRRRFERNVAIMHDMADSLVQSRRAKGMVGARGDLLDVMLSGVDPQSGEALSDENIRFQLVTFLIAGHETTSGLLSFAIHLLLKHPEIHADARNAVDQLLGGREPTIDDLARVPIIEHILMETLRLWPTAPAFAVTPLFPTTIAGRHPVLPGQELLVLLPVLHRERAVWGEDADQFRPSRFARQSGDSIPQHAWKPFGNGARACIGRNFALQEAQLVLILMLQRFDISACDPEYMLKVCETLTMKPDGLRIRAKARPMPKPPVALADSRPIPAAPPLPHALQAKTGCAALRVFYGGNSGSCLHFAQKLVVDAAGRGLRGTLDALDDAVGICAPGDTIVILTASYEGQPPDNARAFVAWVEALEEEALAGCRYAVLGLGNRQWASTYQAIPKRVFAAMTRAGAKPILDLGALDTGGEFFDDAEHWTARLLDHLAPGGESGGGAPAPSVAIDILPPGGANGGSSWVTALCKANDLLTAPTIERGQEKRHIELVLPPGSSYRVGDYLGVLPSNPPGLVKRMLARLGLSAQSRVVLRDHAGLPFWLEEGVPLEAGTLFTHYVELGKPATRDQLRAMIDDCACPPERAQAEQWLAPEIFAREVSAKGLTLLDLLDRFPSTRVEIGKLLMTLPPMAIRRYSISSAPGYRPGQCSLTISVLDSPALRGEGRHLGAASNTLARLEPGDMINVLLLPGNPVFVLPQDTRTPIIMIAAGSGIAPFRGFMQQRQIDGATGQALLFFGCRHAEQDYLYNQELAAWTKAGAVEVRPIFSRQSNDRQRYVQHLLSTHRKDIVGLVQAGAYVYVCGDAMGFLPEVEKVLLEVAAEALDVTEPVARRWVRRHMVAQGRYAVDAFT